VRKIAILGLVALVGVGCATTTSSIPDRAVATVAAQRFNISTAAGRGDLALYVSRDWQTPQPGVTQAVILVHGLLGRDVYVRTADELAVAADAGRTTVLIAPQFLSDLDVKSHRLPDTLLHWRPSAPGAGGKATGPAPITSFEVMDVILARLADRARFPDLRRVVVAGHSGGGQLVQRYAVVGYSEAALTAAGIAVRYVVANPSSYLYFSAERPRPNGGFAPFDESRCPAFNRWRYGLIDAPAYVVEKSPGDLERAYAAREVIYLLGTADNDPTHYELDTSCGGEAQGPHRYARGTAYMRYMQMRHPSGLNHRLQEVPGVGHQGKAMFVSACGLAALFDRPGCGQS
jgi:pimeloyl-ACP methyl ester carboxylesterase